MTIYSLDGKLSTLLVVAVLVATLGALIILGVS
jgi:hypothetical protein